MRPPGVVTLRLNAAGDCIPKRGVGAHLKDMAHDAPIINMVNLLLTRAVEKRASSIISLKTNILELGRTLGNISDACRKLGVSRTHYYTS